MKKLALHCSEAGCPIDPAYFAISYSSGRTAVQLSYCRRHAPALGMDYRLRDPRLVDPKSIGQSLEECKLHMVLLATEDERYPIVLKSKKSNMVFVIESGYTEAYTIYGLATKSFRSSPTTHELMVNLIRSLQFVPTNAIVDGFDKATGVYQCRISIAGPKGPLDLQCRISDAVALSVVTDMPVMVDSAFMGTDLG